MSKAAELIKSLNLRGSSESMKRFKATFKDLIGIMNDNDIDYCIIGAIAYAQYHPRPRSTSDIDLMIFESDADKLISLLDDFNLVKEDDSHYKIIVGKELGIDQIEILITVGMSPDSDAINTATKMQIFGVDGVYVCKPEPLVALYLQAASGGVDKSFIDAKEFIKNKLVNIAKLRNILEDSWDNSLLKLLDDALSDKSLIKESVSRSWSATQALKRDMN